MAEPANHADQRKAPEHDGPEQPEIPAGPDGTLLQQRAIRPGRRLRSAGKMNELIKARATRKSFGKFLRSGLDSPTLNRFNSAPLQHTAQHARIAQLVEQGIENPRVGGLISFSGTIRFNDKARFLAGFVVSGRLRPHRRAKLKGRPEWFPHCWHQYPWYQY